MRAGAADRTGAGRSRHHGEDDQRMLCLTCHRVRPALSRADYTAERAWLIVRRGLCACAVPPPQRTRRAPAVRKRARSPK